MKGLLVSIVLFLNMSCFGQKNDYVWIIGGNSVNHLYNGFQWGTAIANFKQDPVSFEFDNRITMDLSGTNSIVSDNTGKLMMYSNGMYVQNYLHRDIPGLDTISYSLHWENFNYHNYLPDGSDWKSGLSGNQWILMIPDPSNASAYYIFHPYVELSNGPSYLAHFMMSKVIFDDQAGEGRTVFKDSIVNSGIFQWGLTAVRHGNGRDWWLIHGTKYNLTYDIYLLDPAGIHLHHREDEIYRSFHRNTYEQLCFSPRGDKLVVAEGLELTDTIRISIYDFDRCSGHLSKKSSKLLTLERYFIYGSTAFSPDGKYLYYNDGIRMYQCDMDVDDILSTEMVVATYDGSVIEYYDGKLIFYKMALGPDGRIYCIPPGNTRSIHTIEYPEEKGAASTIIQNKIALPIKNFNSIPNVPYYRLGPFDGSSCDTLDLDNNPVANFRYAQDTTDALTLRLTDLSYFRPESWEWDFGDGTYFSGRKPFNHTFPIAGNYKVCLTVKNEISMHTQCRDIIIGTTSSDDVQMLNVHVSLFPNPVEDAFNVNISEYIPSDAKLVLCDVLGNRLLNKKVFYGQNTINVDNLPRGVYLYTVTENGLNIKDGKIVKL